MYEKDFLLQVAEFVIRIYTSEKAHLYIPDGYIPYIYKGPKMPDAEIEVVQGLPFDPLKVKEIFRAVDNETAIRGSMLWNITEKDEKFFVFTAEPYRNIFPYLCADFSELKRNWTIFNSEIIQNNGSLLLNPLAYPMGPLLLYHLALFNNAVMIHASGIDCGTEGYLFTGFSGVGKSTMAGLWQKAGYPVINDDRLLIRKSGDNYCLYNTPMTYADTPKKVILNAAFLLKQSPSNYIEKIPGITGTTRLMAFFIQHHYEKKHIGLILNTASDIARHTDIYELGFVPDHSIIELIKNKRNHIII